MPDDVQRLVDEGQARGYLERTTVKA